MIFVNENYDNYKYLVEVGDNYIVLSNSSSVHGSWQDPDTYEVIYQYLTPSTLVIEETRTTTSENYFTRIETSSEFWKRADAPNIFFWGLGITFFALFIINQLTRIVKRGGLLG